MAAPKGFQPPGGSRKGRPNKITADLKAMILGALEDAGGQEYLKECAQNPSTASAFLTLVGKVLPLQIHGSGANGEIVYKRIEAVVVDPKG